MTFKQFFQRLFPRFFKQPVSSPSTATTVNAPVAVAITPPTPTPQPTVTIPTAPTPLPPSTPSPTYLPRNGDMLTPGTMHGFVPGTDTFKVEVTVGKPIQLATSEGYGSGYVKLIDSGVVVGSSTIGNGYSSLYFSPNKTQTLDVEVVCNQAGNIAQQLGQQ